MVLAGIEGIVTLCIALGSICICQIIICGTLSFTMSEVLAFSGSIYPTGATLVAGLIAVPATTRLRMSKVLPNMDRVFGYTLCYLQLIVGISLTTNLIAAVLAIVGIWNSTNIGLTFLELLHQYHTKQISKEMIDNVQWILQCCGSYNYLDWFNLEWSGQKFNRETEIRYINMDDLFSDYHEIKERSLTRRLDAVPFSCCAKAANGTCVHHDLDKHGTGTINKIGCSVKLKRAVNTLLWFEFGINIVSVCLEVGIMVLLKLVRIEDGEAFSSSRICKYRRIRKSYSSFYNEHGTVAEIIPSTHSQVTLTTP